VPSWATDVLVRIVANSLLRAWWLDALVALAVAVVAVRDGRQARNGEVCC